MINANLLRGKMAARGYNQESLAKKMHISANTLSAKINGKAIFNLEETWQLCELLNIESDREKCEIFFDSASL